MSLNQIRIESQRCPVIQRRRLVLAEGAVGLGERQMIVGALSVWRAFYWQPGCDERKHALRLRFVRCAHADQTRNCTGRLEAAITKFMLRQVDESGDGFIGRPHWQRAPPQFFVEIGSEWLLEVPRMDGGTNHSGKRRPRQGSEIRGRAFWPRHLVRPAADRRILARPASPVIPLTIGQRVRVCSVVQLMKRGFA